MITTRGFTGRGRAKADQRRVPPGQYVTEDFPVLSAGPTPHTSLDGWTLTLQDGGSLVGKWTWEEFQALPRTELTVDIHCVTKWSKLGTVWEGVTIDDLLSAAGLEFVLDVQPGPGWRESFQDLGGERSEERRVGKECSLLCRSRWSPYH